MAQIDDLRRQIIVGETWRVAGMKTELIVDAYKPGVVEYHYVEYMGADRNNHFMRSEDEFRLRFE